MALSYLVSAPGSSIILGLSTDEKPSCPSGCVFIEQDTAKIFRNAAGWAEVLNPAYALVGGGSDSEVSLYKALDQSITSAGWVDVTGLSFSVAALKAYLIEAHLIYQTSATAMGVRLGVNGPASPTLLHLHSRKEITAVATAGTDKFSEALISAYDTANPAATSEIAQAANLAHLFRGVFVNGTNAGTLAFRMDKENVAGTATVKAGSWVRYRLLN